MRASGYGLLPAPNISSSVGRARHRYRGVREFESHCSLEFSFFKAKKRLFKLLRTPKIIPLILKKEWIKNTHKWYKRERNINDEYTLQCKITYSTEFHFLLECTHMLPGYTEHIQCEVTSFGMTNSPTCRSNSWILAPHGAKTEVRRVSSITWRVYLQGKELFVSSDVLELHVMWGTRVKRSTGKDDLKCGW